MKSCIAMLWSFFLTSLLAATPPGEDIRVWAVPSIHKIRPDEPVQEKNYVWTGKTKQIRLSGAANEHVPFQLVITAPPPPNRYTRPVSDLWVEMTGLVSGDHRIRRESIELFLEHVILVYAQSSPVGETGFWPDALAPLTDPFDMSAAFRRSVRNRGIWVNINVPPGTPSGLYEGNVRIEHQGQPVDALKVELWVHSFGLPKETHLLTYMGVSPRRLAQAHGLDPSSEETRRLLTLYHRFLYERRMEPWFNWLLQPEVKVAETGEVQLEFDETLYRLYLDELGMKRLVLEAAPRHLLSQIKATPFSERFNAIVRDYVTRVAAYLREHDWLDRLVLNSPIDEPNTAQHYADTRRWADLVHSAVPSIPFLVTESPVPDNPDWGPLTGHANNFSVHGNKLNDPLVKDEIKHQRQKGGEITWYISCDQKFPQPNYFIDASAMDPVMIPWITLRYGMNGFLYWAVDYWTQTPTPWLDPVTYLSGFFCSDGYVLNGEGSLLYPGNRVHQYTGQRNVDGPVSSIRLELLREGLEDTEYLRMLEKLGDADLARDVVREMVVDVRTFSRNRKELFRQRERMARRIEELQKARSVESGNRP